MVIGDSERSTMIGGGYGDSVIGDCDGERFDGERMVKKRESRERVLFFCLGLLSGIFFNQN